MQLPWLPTHSRVLVGQAFSSFRLVLFKQGPPSAYQRLRLLSPSENLKEFGGRPIPGVTSRSKSSVILLSRCRNLSFPDSLPEVSIVFIFVNEALSVLLRSIHSAMERTPAHLLKEIILVDDNSSSGECSPPWSPAPGP